MLYAVAAADNDTVSAAVAVATDTEAAVRYVAAVAIASVAASAVAVVSNVTFPVAYPDFCVATAKVIGVADVVG